MRADAAALPEWRDGRSASGRSAVHATEAPFHGSGDQDSVRVAGNRCAFGACDEQLTDPAWEGVNADIAHIIGLNHGSARHICNFPNVNGFDNLLLLCKNHHNRVDALEPSKYSVDDLLALKQRAEERAEKWQTWTTDERLEEYVAMTAKMIALATEPSLTALTQPSLKLTRRDDRIMLVNVGQLPAFQWNIDPRNDMESFERGVSFGMMQSWEHNEHGPLPGMEERQIGEVTDPARLAKHPEMVILRWSNSVGESFNSFEHITSEFE